MTIDVFEAKDFVNPHYVRTEVAPGLWLYVLTGTVKLFETQPGNPAIRLHAGFKGESGATWRHETVRIIRTLPGLPQGKGLRLIHWAPLVTLSSIYNEGSAINSGHAVDSFSMESPRTIRPDVVIRCDIAVRDSDAWLYRLGYHVVLLGRLADYIPPVV